MVAVKRYIFQPSRIWEAGDPVDKNKPPVRIRAKSEGKARAKLKDPGLGRKWILVEVIEIPQKEAA